MIFRCRPFEAFGAEHNPFHLLGLRVDFHIHGMIATSRIKPFNSITRHCVCSNFFRRSYTRFLFRKHILKWDVEPQKCLPSQANRIGLAYFDFAVIIWNFFGVLEIQI